MQGGVATVPLEQQPFRRTLLDDLAVGQSARRFDADDLDDAVETAEVARVARVERELSARAVAAIGRSMDLAPRGLRPVSLTAA